MLQKLFLVKQPYNATFSPQVANIYNALTSLFVKIAPDLR